MRECHDRLAHHVPLDQGGKRVLAAPLQRCQEGTGLPWKCGLGCNHKPGKVGHAYVRDGRGLELPQPGCQRIQQSVKDMRKDLDCGRAQLTLGGPALQ